MTSHADIVSRTASEDEAGTVVFLAVELILCCVIRVLQLVTVSVLVRTTIVCVVERAGETRLKLLGPRIDVCLVEYIEGCDLWGDSVNRLIAVRDSLGVFVLGCDELGVCVHSLGCINVKLRVHWLGCIVVVGLCTTSRMRMPLSRSGTQNDSSNTVSLFLGG